jgi:hypothetical protein
MEIIIQDVISTVRATEAGAAIGERDLARIVRAVLAAVRAEREAEANREADAGTHSPTPGRGR